MPERRQAVRRRIPEDIPAVRQNLLVTRFFSLVLGEHCLSQAAPDQLQAD
jgi:hypothetical protein